MQKLCGKTVFGYEYVVTSHLHTRLKRVEEESHSFIAIPKLWAMLMVCIANLFSILIIIM